MIVKALESLRPDAEYSLNAGEYSQLVWLDENQTKPTEEEINAWILANSDRVLVLMRLQELDLILPRLQEDIINELNLAVFGDVADALAEKIALRLELA